jgi:hypothetical protein
MCVKLTIRLIEVYAPSSSAEAAHSRIKNRGRLTR